MLESLFNKVARMRACNFIEKRLRHRCFPLKSAKFEEHLRTTTSTATEFWRIGF